MFLLRRKEPPGAMLRYDGRLTTPSACPHIVRLSWLSYPDEEGAQPPQRCDLQERSLWGTRSPRNGSSLQNHLERLHSGRNVR